MSLPDELAPGELALEQDVESRHDDDGVVGSTSMPIKSSGKDLVSEKGMKSTGGNSKSMSDLSDVSCGGLSGHSDDCCDPFSEVLLEL